MSNRRATGLLVIAAIYVVAVGVGLGIFALVPGSWPLRLLVADVSATVFVFLTSLPLRNASVYDPYWSVAPPVICTGFAIAWQNWSAAVVVVLLVVWFWGVRLTVNWVVTFRGLGSQDWRYDDLQRQFPRLFPLIALVGVMLFPTLVVYGCTVPAVVFIGGSSLNAVWVVGVIMSLAGVGLELVADAQMQAFRRTNTDHSRIIRTGVWRYARHPNYLGEILMWWGVAATAVAAVPGLWWLCVGALVNWAMFVFISIPMADRRNEALRDGFDEYRAQTRALIPIIPLLRRGGSRAATDGVVGYLPAHAKKDHPGASRHPS